MESGGGWGNLFQNPLRNHGERPCFIKAVEEIAIEVGEIPGLKLSDQIGDHSV